MILKYQLYVIEDEEGTELERECPFASSLVFLYNPIEGLGFYVGPGIEFEGSENLFLINVGISYEVTFNDYWDMSPELGYEIKGGHTGVFTFGVCVGLRLGKK